MFALAFQYLAIVYLAIGKKIFHCFRRKTTQLPPAPPTINPIYVVFRGRVPGVYTTEADLLRNITNLEGTHFASFVRPAEATSAWCDALANEKVHPIEETNPSPLRLWEDRPAYFNSVEIAASSGVPLDSVGVARRARRSAKSHISRLLELVLDSALEGPGPKLTSAELAQQEFHQPSNSEGAKWIVLQGRKPGIFDTWAAVHAEVHGLTNPLETYQKFPSLALAQLAWERLAQKGYIRRTYGKEEFYPLDAELVGCNQCGDENYE